MNLYAFRAVTSDGKVVNGTMPGTDAHAVLNELRASGHLPISAEPAKRFSVAALRDLRALIGRGNRIKPRSVTALTRELAMLLKAGIAMDSCLRTLERHCNDRHLKQVLADVREAVRSGKSLSDALARHRDAFNDLYVSLVKAGEAEGSLSAALERITDYRERLDSFRATLVSSLAYPLILSAVALLSLVILMGFVVPSFIPLFADADAPLPVLTRLVFGASEFVRQSWWLMLLLACGALIYFERWRGNAGNRRRLDSSLLRIPVAGDLLLHAETARVMRTLGSLLGSGLTLPSSLKLSAAVSQNAAVRTALEDCRTAIEQGGRLTRALEESNILPELALELVAIGEESGQLERMLIQTAETFETRTQTSLKRVLTLIEPVTILGLGGIIALVIISILMAMLGLNDLVGS